MSEIEPIDEACFLIEACEVGGRFTGFRPSFVDSLKEHGFISLREGNLGCSIATITPAGKARLKKLVEQLTRSVNNDK